MEITFQVKLSIGFPGATREGELTIEVDNDATPEEIENEKESAATDWMNNYLDLSWK